MKSEWKPDSGSSCKFEKKTDTKTRTQKNNRKNDDDEQSLINVCQREMIEGRNKNSQIDIGQAKNTSTKTLLVIIRNLDLKFWRQIFFKSKTEMETQKKTLIKIH